MKYDSSSKIISSDLIADKVLAWKEDSKTIAFTNGCFDILHSGHVQYLETAANMADILIVGLNSDHSVQMLKGPTRPIVDQEDRAVIVSALEAVSCVTIFDEITPDHLIKAVLPDVLIKGGDYVAEEIVGYDTVMQNGGKVEIVPFVNGKSTTNIVNSIMEQK